MIIGELTYLISPGLNRALLKACPGFKEAVDRARQRIADDPKVSHLAKEFDFVNLPSVENSDQDRAKPIFRLDDHLEVHFNNADWCMHKEETRALYSLASSLACQVRTEIEKEKKLPTRIHYEGKVVLLRHFKNADKYYCLPEEAERLKQKADKMFSEAKSYG